MKKNCPHCGSANDPVQYCVNCGRDIASLFTADDFERKKREDDELRRAEAIKQKIKAEEERQKQLEEAEQAQARLDQNDICAECGNPLKPNTRFCSKCGHDRRKALPRSIKCPSCAVQIPEDSAFCPYCGQRIAPSTRFEAEPASFEAPSASHRQFNRFRTRQTAVGNEPIKPDQLTHTVIKQTAHSPLFIVAAIAFSAAILLNLFLFSIFSIDLFDTTTDLGPLLAIISMVPSVMIAAGLWQTVEASFDRYSLKMKTVGLTMIKSVVILQTVLFCITMAILVGYLSFSIYNWTRISEEVAHIPNLSSIYSSYVTIGIILIPVICAAAALMVAYYLKIVQSINTVKRSIYSGMPSDRVSPCVAVISYIVGGFALLAAIICVTQELWLVALSAAVSAVYSIAFGYLLFSYRSKMSALIVGGAPLQRAALESGIEPSRLESDRPMQPLPRSKDNTNKIIIATVTTAMLAISILVVVLFSVVFASAEPTDTPEYVENLLCTQPWYSDETQTGTTGYYRLLFDSDGSGRIQRYYGGNLQYSEYFEWEIDEDKELRIENGNSSRYYDWGEWWVSKEALYFAKDSGVFNEGTYKTSRWNE